MVDNNLTFDDGEPITNSKLQSLYNAIKVLEGNVAKTTITDQTTNTKYTPIVYAGKTGTVDIPSVGKTGTVDIVFQGFQTDSVFVTATPVRTSVPSKGAFNWSIVNITKAGAQIKFNNTDSSYGGKTSFHFIAVEMKQSS